MMMFCKMKRKQIEWNNEKCNTDKSKKFFLLIVNSLFHVLEKVLEASSSFKRISTHYLTFLINYLTICGIKSHLEQWSEIINRLVLGLKKLYTI